MDFSKAMPRPELIAMVQTLAEQKGLEKEVMFQILEDAMLKIARNQFGHELDLQVMIDRKTGAILVKRKMTVVPDDYVTKTEVIEAPDDGTEPEIIDLFNENRNLTLTQAKKKDKNLKVDDVVEDYLPALYFGRQAFQSVRQIVMAKIKGADREKQYEEFKDRIGEVVNCVVKQNEYGNLYVEINNKAEGYIKRNELIPREMPHTGDRFRALVLSVEKSTSGPQIFLSRSHPNFMAKLFAMEVPEIYEGTIEVRAVARDPGSHAKVAVWSKDPSQDPVGTSVGMRGSRIQPIINELQGEKIDVIAWSDDVAELAVRAITPAKALKVVVDEEDHKIEIAVAQDNLSQAIGRGGQNVRLASKLVGWQIDVMSEEKEAEIRTKEINERISLFIAALDIDEVIARLLLSEGFRNIEEIAYVDKSELTSINGFEPELVDELQIRAQAYLNAKQQEFDKKVKELKIDKSLIDFEDVNMDQKILLANSDVRSREDLADLSTEELQAILTDLDENQINKIIMKAREIWFNE